MRRAGERSRSTASVAVLGIVVVDHGPVTPPSSRRLNTRKRGQGTCRGLQRASRRQRGGPAGIEGGCGVRERPARAVGVEPGHALLARKLRRGSRGPEVPARRMRRRSGEKGRHQLSVRRPTGVVVQLQVRHHRMLRARCRKLPSDSSASATIHSPAPHPALTAAPDSPPRAARRRDEGRVGPDLAEHVREHPGGGGLRGFQATAISLRSAQDGARRWITRRSSSAPRASSGLSSPTAIETTTCTCTRARRRRRARVAAPSGSQALVSTSSRDRCRSPGRRVDRRRGPGRSSPRRWR